MLKQLYAGGVDANNAHIWQRDFCHLPCEDAAAMEASSDSCFEAGGMEAHLVFQGNKLAVNWGAAGATELCRALCVKRLLA